MCNFDNQVQIIDLLLARGANVNMTTRDSVFATALHIAVQRRFSDLALSLLNHGAAVDPATPRALPPLIVAINKKDVRVVSRMIKLGTNVNVRTTTGKTALTVAIELRAEEIVALLKAAGAVGFLSSPPQSRVVSLEGIKKRLAVDLSVAIEDWFEAINSESEVPVTVTSINAVEGSITAAATALDVPLSPAPGGRFGRLPSQPESRIREADLTKSAWITQSEAALRDKKLMAPIVLGEIVSQALAIASAQARIAVTPEDARRSLKSGLVAVKEKLLIENSIQAPRPLRDELDCIIVSLDDPSFSKSSWLTLRNALSGWFRRILDHLEAG